jgi:hypothetical protein
MLIMLIIDFQCFQLMDFLPPARPGIGWVLRKRTNLTAAALASLSIKLLSLSPSQPLSALNLDDNSTVPKAGWLCIAAALTLAPSVARGLSFQANALDDEVQMCVHVFFFFVFFCFFLFFVFLLSNCTSLSHAQ